MTNNGRLWWESGYSLGFSFSRQFTTLAVNRRRRTLLGGGSSGKSLDPVKRWSFFSSSRDSDCSLSSRCHTTRRNLLLSPFKFNRFKHKEGEKKRKRTKKSKKRGEIDDGQGVVSAVQLKIGVIRTGIILMEDMSFSGGSSNITRGSSSSSSRGESGSNPSSLLPRARFNIRYDIPLRNLWYWVLERRDNEERARRNKSIVFSSFFYCLF